MFRRKGYGKKTGPRPGTSEHARWMAEQERSLGLLLVDPPAEYVAEPPAEVLPPVEVAVATRAVVAKPPDVLPADPYATSDRAESVAAARAEWERLATGMPFETCRQPLGWQMSHFPHWHILWYVDADGTSRGKYRCIACYPELRVWVGMDAVAARGGGGGGGR